MPYDTVLYSVAERVATITMNRPDERNALNGQLVGDLIAAFREAQHDAAAGVIVLAGAGKVFCAGGDLKGMSGDTSEYDRHLGRRKFVELNLAITEGGKPVIAKVHGHALAGGCGLAVACDMVYAADTAQFGTPEINVGLFPMMIMAALFRNMGRKKGMEFILTGDRISAAEAEQRGLITKCVPAGELDAAVAALCAKLTAKSPLLLKLGRDAFYKTADMSYREALEYLNHELGVVLRTEDALEGLMAFMQKREPEWKNR